MDNFVVKLKGYWTDFLSWFGQEEQKLASFFFPMFKSLKGLVTKDALTAIIEYVPQIAEAYASGGYDTAIATANLFLIPFLKKEGVVLEQAIFAQLSNAMVSQAQESLAKTATTTAGVAT